MLDPVALSKQLISIESITPANDIIIDELIAILKPLGFECHKINFGQVSNLYARLGTHTHNLCFAGHSDVVEPGTNWKYPPFTPTVENNILYGRGTQDMKAAIACFIVAVERFIQKAKPDISLSLLISGNEEGDPTDGMVKTLEWLRTRKEHISDCVVGEPTNLHQLGDNVKIGRKGSINFTLTITGIQGHVAFPDVATNPATQLTYILFKLKSAPIDKGTEFFSPTNLEITDLHIGNNTCNVIPEKASAKFNIRFNNLQTVASLAKWVDTTCQQYSTSYDLKYESSADACLPDTGILQPILQEVIREKTGIEPNFTTIGGTSDARFIKQLCPVLEFGMLSDKAHKVNESVKIDDIYLLTDIYLAMLEKYSQLKTT